MSTELSSFLEPPHVPAWDEVCPGQVLGRYELLLPIAKGGMAMVWAGRLKGTRGFQKMVALKTMLPSVADDPKFERMFLAEASLAAGVRHPNVVEILDLGEQDHVLYLVMEWVDGEPLNIITRYAEKDGGIPLAIAVHLVCQACKGLHAAHELRDEEGRLVGLVHRDVSPQNVLVTYNGVVKIVDFGVAKATARAASDTEDGRLRGKIAYMSPEQVRGEKLDRRTDIFALGILLYMLTTGEHPLRGDDQAATIRNIGSDRTVLLPRSVIPDYPPALEAVVMKALAKDASHRFQTASEMLKALSAALPQELSASDEDVQAFMRKILPERLEKRRRAFREALRSADRASDPPPFDAGPADEPAHDAGRNSAAYHDFLSAPRASPVPTPSLYSIEEESLNGSTTAPEIDAQSRWLKRASLIGIVALGVGAAAAVSWSAFRPPQAGPLPPAGELRDDVAPRGDGFADTRSSGVDAGTAEPQPVTPGAQPASEAPASGASRGKVTRPKRPKASKENADDFVSPIRDPGF